MPRGEVIEKLFSTPGGMPTSGLENELFDVVRGLGWAGDRSARPLFEGLRSMTQVAVDPLVPRLPADAVAFAQLSEREDVAEIARDEMYFLIHR